MSDETEINSEVEASPLVRKLEQQRLGRFALGLMRWTVVAALIVAGYIGADAVSSGIKLASHDGVGSELLAASSK